MMGGSWKRVRDSIAQMLFGHTRRRTSHRRRNRDTSLRGESLEPRRLLAANQITYDATSHVLTIEGTAGGDNVQVWVDTASNVQVTLTNATGTNHKTYVRSAVAQIQFFGGDGNDLFNNGTDITSVAFGEGGNDELIGGTSSNYLFGGSGDDRLVGGNSADHLDGQDGKDAIFGRAGDDYIVGGLGDDGLYGDDGNDELLGQDGADYFEGGADIDRMWGGAGDDYMLGGLGNDGLYGQDGNDQLFGEDGADYLDGGAGVDTLTGGAGDDYAVGGLGIDGIYGQHGNDNLFGDDGADYLDGGTGNDKMFGRAGDDYIVGDVGDDGLYGDDGNDQLFGQDGADYFEGGAGNDSLSGSTGDDYMLGGSGDDGMYGHEGNDHLFGDAGADYVDGGAGNDSLSGGADNDYIVGGVGNDGLYGHGGIDRLYGEDGADYLSGGADNDLLWGGTFDDYLVGGAGDDALYAQDGNDQLFGDDGADFLDGGAGIDRLWGSTGNDYLAGGLGNDTLYGQDDDDTLFGDDGNDYIDGGSGIDNMWGGVGDDSLVGGIAVDSMYGEDGNDQLFGQDGADYLVGGAGDDLMWGSAGDDYLLGGFGADRLYGDAGNDQLHGENGDDTLDGGAGNDVVAGGFGDDGVIGGDGADQLSGNEGNDYLVGGVGTDMLTGGSGYDVLIGGLEVDQLQGEANDDVLIGGTTIYDGDAAKLRALVGVWALGLPYLARTQAIEDDLFVAHLESNETVFDDQVLDWLYGNGGDDWFFMTGYQGIYNPVSHDHGHDHGGETEPPHDHKQIIVDTIPEREGFEFVDSLDRFIDWQATELVHSLVPHADNPTLQREHLSLYQLIRYDQVTHTAMRSGAWSDPTIWQNGIMPSDGARVLIPIGVQVQVDGLVLSRLATVRVDGTLSFSATRSSTLRVDTMVVTDTGRFEMGTQAAPIPNGVMAMLLFTDNGPIDRTWDPYGISRGLISHGSVSIFGASVTPYAALTGAATAGSSVLTLSGAVSNWKVGDMIVVASTSEGATQNESRVIVAINGTTVTLDRPLSYNHVAPAGNLSIHVAHLTRNAIMQSESAAVDRRGHVMFMHNRDVHIAYGGFYQLGRTNKLIPLNDSVVGSNWTLQPGTGTNQRARYPIHFHRNGLTNDANPSSVVGSSVVDAPGWGYVNHSSYVDMFANVAFNVRGAAFATEVGDEIGIFANNLAVGSTGSNELINYRESLQDFGHQGDGFWFQGAGVHVVGNVSAGNQGHAYVYYNRGLFENGVQAQFSAANLVNPSIAMGSPTISIGLVPIAQFSNNVGYASAEGLLIRYHLQGATHGGRSVVADSLFWNNTIGVDLHYAESVTIRRVSVIHDSSNRPLYAFLTNIIEGFIDYENITVGNYINGIMLPRWGTNTVTGGTFFNNAVDILIPTALGHDRVVNLTGQLQQAKIVAWQNLLSYQYSDVANFFVNDTVLLNFGSFVNLRLYGLIQKADAIPFPVARPDAPSHYIGLTNQQLWDQYHVAIGGAIAPSTAISVPLITGLIAPNI